MFPKLSLDRIELTKLHAHALQKITDFTVYGWLESKVPNVVIPAVYPNLTAKLVFNETTY